MFDVNIFLFITNLFIVLICGVLFIAMPYLTRKSYLFGVKIPVEHSGCPEARALKKRYINVCALWILFMFIIHIIQFITWRDMTLMAALYMPILIIPVYLLAYVPNWKKALRLKEERGWHVPNVLYAETSSSHSRGAMSELPWIWYALGLIVTAATFVLSIARYPMLPDMIPGHLNAAMQPSYYIDKTWLSVMMMPLFNAGMLAIMFLVAISIEKAKLQIDPAKPRLSFAQHRIYRRRMGNALGFLALYMVIFMAALGLGFIFPLTPAFGAFILWTSMIFFLVPTVYLVVTQLKLGQGGCHIKTGAGLDNLVNTINMADASGAAENFETQSYTTSVSGRPGAPSYTSGAEDASAAHAASGPLVNVAGNDDKFWVLGMFYYNPDDPAHIIENRFGTKLGFNFARFPVKIATVLIFIGIAALYVWMTVLLS